MNYIGLDISKISTAVSIETSDGKNYLFSYNTNKSTYKWNKNLIGIEGVKIRTYEYDNTIDDYSEKEVNKLVLFINIANDIIEDILSVLNITEESIIYIEGYSYGRDPGPIIDLVGIGTIVRGKLYENISLIREMKIIAPKSLKVKCCEMIYGTEMIEIGKRKKKIVKVINTNKDGVKGGDFSKHDMFQALIDYTNPCILDQYFIDNYDEIKLIKTFPKPLEDLDDALLLKEIIKFENHF